MTHQPAESDRAATLLLHALDRLPPDDRELVLRALLTGSIGRAAHRSQPPMLGAEMVAEHGSFRPGVESVRQVEQPLLVRLPTDLHSRLRTWATDNGFSMAAIVRGLLERFLAEQEARPGSP
jgi:hypothetical protein